MSKERPKLILASASPRRKQLLELAGLSFTVEAANVPEEVPEGMPLEDQSEYLALLKAGAVKAFHPADVVLGSDTTVACEGRLMGKPATPEEAREMLHLLSGRTHTVYTGVAILGPKSQESFTSATEVEFYELTEEEIEAYVASGEPMDKAGAYGIQGTGCRFVKGIRGDYFTVVGLPLAEVVRKTEALLK